MRIGITISDPKGITATSAQDDRPWWHKDFWLFYSLIAVQIACLSMIFYVLTH